MKKTITFILLLAVLFTYSGECSAQFLKILEKSIENASKQVDRFLGSEESANTNNAETNSSKITVSSPHRNLKVNIIGAEMSGENYILEFTITNKGENIRDYRMDRSTNVYDNLGTQCRAEIIIGNSQSSLGSSAGGSLLNDTPMKVRVVLSGFSSKATSFTQIRIKGEAWDYGYNNRPDGDFVFKNVPIIKNEEVEVVIPVKKADTPVEEKRTSQLITEKPISQNVGYEQKEVLPLSNVIKFSSYPKAVEFRELCNLEYWKVVGITCIKANRFKIKVKGLKDSRQLTPGQCSLSIAQGTKGSFGIKKAYIGAYSFPRIQEGEVKEFEIVTAPPHAEFAGFVIYRSKMGSPYEI
ncbi:hypothetical protein [Dysgonomonas sp. 511]|uniref:hypothetical protein n=1 Tax=Dysgonomonas sp. 511 TaxID=2302930 RepID=UPI0013D154ED|nr:hypothetical protein [Dysgonomonas sp. 511]